MKAKLVVLFFLACINASARCDSYNLGGRPGEGYIIEVMIGTPPQKFNVLVDTGSTNFAIAAAPHPNIDSYFVQSNSTTSRDLEQPVLLQYTQGRWAGTLASDVVYFPTLNSVLVVTCDIALINDSQGFFMNGSNWQGILGLAYPLIAQPSSSVRPWIDSLQKKYKDKTIAFSLTLCGTEKPGNNDHYGLFEVLNNMIHPYKGLLTATVVREGFYEVILSGILIDGTPLAVDCRELNSDKSIIDSGTTNIRLPKDVFEKFVNMIIPASKKVIATRTNATRKMDRNRTVQKTPDEGPDTAMVLEDEFWSERRTACSPHRQSWDDMPVITMQLASGKDKYFHLNLPGSSYIRQVFENPDQLYCYKFSVEPSSAGSILGVVAMEGFQVIFNRTARNVGFLRSDCGPRVSLSGPFAANLSQADSLLARCSHTEVLHVSLLNIAAYVVCATLLLSSFMFAYLLGQWIKTKYFKCSNSGATVSMSHASLINEDS